MARSEDGRDMSGELDWWISREGRARIWHGREPETVRGKLIAFFGIVISHVLYIIRTTCTRVQLLMEFSYVIKFIICYG